MTQYDIPEPAPLQDLGEDALHEAEGLADRTGQALVLLKDLPPIPDSEGQEVDQSQLPIGWIDL